MNQENVSHIIEEAKNQHIHSLYLAVGRILYELGCYSEDRNKTEFLKILDMLVRNKSCIIYFHNLEERELNNASISEKIHYISNSFPIEYNENIPEKDIDNLWWYCFCPVDIGWKQPDGSYFISD